MFVGNLLFYLSGNGNKASIGQPILRYTVILQLLCENLGECVSIQDMNPKGFLIKQPLAPYYFYALAFVLHFLYLVACTLIIH